MKLKVALAADHGGFPLKAKLLPWIRARGHEVLDMGAFALEPDDDYPDFAEAAGQAMVSGRVERAILVCGSGVGASIAANKIPGIRASLCHETYSARQGVEHDDMNVLCLGAWVIGVETARELVAAFLSASFSGEQRHLRRLGKVLDIERRALPKRKGGE